MEESEHTFELQQLLRGRLLQANHSKLPLIEEVSQAMTPHIKPSFVSTFWVLSADVERGNEQLAG